MSPADRSRRKLIVHHHIFKNAGTSLDRALGQAFGPAWATFESDDPSGHLVFEDVRTFLDENWQIAALSSHQLLPQLSAEGFDLFPIVFVREPISRVRSAYLFEWQKQLGLDEPKGSLADYVSEKLLGLKESVIGDFQIAHLSGARRRAPGVAGRSEEDELKSRLESAKAFLEQVPCFGLVEEYDDSIRLLNLHLGSFSTEAPLLEVFKANVLQDPDQAPEAVHEVMRSEMGQGLFDEVVARNQGDLALYDFAQSRFARLTCDPGFHPEVDDLTVRPGRIEATPAEVERDDAAGALLAVGTEGVVADTPEAAEPSGGAASLIARLERRVQWQADLLTRIKTERSNEREQFVGLRDKYLGMSRRLRAAEAPDPNEPTPSPSGRLFRVLAKGQRGLAKGQRGLARIERRLNRGQGGLDEHQRQRALVMASGLFDVDYYLETHPDVAEAGWDPLDHYLLHGGFEGREASELFDSGWYLRRNTDVVENGLHPMLHYLEHGEAEGRQIWGRAHDMVLEEPGFEAHGLPKRERYAEICDGIVFPEIEFDDQVDVTIVVPIYNALDYTISCLQALTELRTRYRFEVVLMDDCSDDPDIGVLNRVSGLRYHRNEENLGFLLNCNASVDVARGRYLAFLNNDTRVDPDWLDGLRDTFDTHDDVGLVGSKLVYPDGRLQEAGGIVWEDASGWNFGRLGDPDHPRFNYVRDVDYVSGASIMIEKAFFESLGRFDERFAPAYYEDTDLGFAVRAAGRRVLYQPASMVVHYEGISSGTDLTSGVKMHQTFNRITFAEKWEAELVGHGKNGIDPLVACDRTVNGHVLIVDSATPTPDQDSGSLDMFNLIRVLQGLGKRVHFIPSNGFNKHDGYTQRLQDLGVECVYQPHYNNLEEYLDDYASLFEVVLLSRAEPAAAAIDTVLERCPEARIIFYTVDLHFLREQREAELLDDESPSALAKARQRREMELGLMDRVDATIVLSEAERKMLVELGKDNIEVVPLIRDVTDVVESSFEDRSGVVFVGGFRHPPNVDAVDWLVGQVWPLVRAEAQRRGVAVPMLRVVGSHVPDHVWDHAGDDVTIYGFVENLRPLFDQARLSVAPLRYGAGLKGKVATSLDYGVPVVGTPIAFEGMPDDGPDEAMLVGTTPAELAAAIVDLHDDADRWRRASLDGQEYVHRHYSLAAVATRIAPILGAPPV